MYTVDTQYVLNMDLYQYLCCWNIINFQRNMFLCFVSNGKDVRLFTLLVWGNIHKMVYTTILYVAKRAFVKKYSCIAVNKRVFYWVNCNYFLYKNNEKPYQSTTCA